MNPQPFARWPGVPTCKEGNQEGKYKMEKEFNGHLTSIPSAVYRPTEQKWSITKKLNNIIILRETFSIITILVIVNRIKNLVLEILDLTLYQQIGKSGKSCTTVGTPAQ